MKKDDALAHLTATEYEWITDKTSLTQKLRVITHNHIQLQLLYDNWGVSSDVSRAILHITTDEKTWIRKIEWRFENQIWLTCEVVIPNSSLTAETQILTQIGNGAIGEVLFKDTTLQRDDFTYQKENDRITRHSIFHFKGKPLLVSETFQSDFFAALK